MSVVNKIMYIDEKIALLLAIAIVSWAFGGNLLLKGNYVAFTINSLVVIIAFLPHELAHRYFARKYGCYSRFILDPVGATITVISGFIPFIKIIIPGYVFLSLPYYDPLDSRKIFGIVSASGPIVNIILAIFSLTLYNIMLHTTVESLIKLFLLYMTGVNAWIAFFNLLPVPPLDGSKVIKWSPITWTLLFIISILIMFTTRF